MLCLGIDPGLKGAWAVVNEERCTSLVSYCSPLPTMQISRGKGKRTVIDLPGLIDTFGEANFWAPQIVVLEKVSGLPQDIGQHAFTFGECYGMLRAIIQMGFKCRIEMIEPSIWKRHMRVGKENQDIAKRADELFPSQTHLWRGPRGGFKDGIAEAAMLALYGTWILNGTVPITRKAK